MTDIKPEFHTLRAHSVLALIAFAPIFAANAAQIAYEDFAKKMARWWVEGGERTWVQDGSLHMKADPETGNSGTVATAWFRQELPADVRIRLEAEVVSSSSGANNINFFLSFSDPKGATLYETRGSRSSAHYSLYHQLNGYIFTFVADVRDEHRAASNERRSARIRIRRCPGFELMAETYAYHSSIGHTYLVEIVKHGGQLIFSVDGHELLRAEDPKPHQGGMFGLRTFRTYLRWSNIDIADLSAGPASRSSTPQSGIDGR